MTTTDKSVLIPTGMYSTDAEKILKILFLEFKGALTIQPRFRRYVADVVGFERAPDNEIMFVVKSSVTGSFGRFYDYWEKILGEDFYDKQPSAVGLKAAINKIGSQIKELARRYSNNNAVKEHYVDDSSSTLGYSVEDYARRRDELDKYFKKVFWKRPSNIPVKPFMKDVYVDECEADDTSITSTDLYLIYEILVGRAPKCLKRYDPKLVKRIIGEKRDVISTEAEIARREEVKKIYAEYDEKLFDATPSYATGYPDYHRQPKAYTELNNFVSNFKKKCEKQREKLIAERDAKIAEVNAAMAFLTA